MLKDQRAVTLAQQVIALFTMVTFALVCFVGYQLVYIIPEKFERLPEKYVLRVELEGKMNAIINQVAELKAIQIVQGARLDRTVDEQNRRSFYFDRKPTR